MKKGERLFPNQCRVDPENTDQSALGLGGPGLTTSIENGCKEESGADIATLDLEALRAKMKATQKAYEEKHPHSFHIQQPLFGGKHQDKKGQERKKDQCKAPGDEPTAKEQKSTKSATKESAGLAFTATNPIHT